MPSIATAITVFLNIAYFSDQLMEMHTGSMLQIRPEISYIWFRYPVIYKAGEFWRVPPVHRSQRMCGPYLPSHLPLDKVLKSRE